MFIYANTASIDRPEVKNFLEFFMNEGGILAEEVGYVALSDADYQSNIELVNAK
jgi:phosphate transport system substrate-binding protein